jgi:hypothetical protein
MRFLSRSLLRNDTICHFDRREKSHFIRLYLTKAHTKENTSSMFY